MSATATAADTFDDIRIATTKDYIYASHPQCTTNDSILVTAHLYEGDRPYKQEGIPVNFTLGDMRFVTQEDGLTTTDGWGTASVTLKSNTTEEILPECPYPVNLTITAGNMSKNITIPVSRHMSLNGSVVDNQGNPVPDATVTLVYDVNNKIVNTTGNPAYTGRDGEAGEYHFERVPMDMGNITAVAKKGNMTSSVTISPSFNATSPETALEL